MLPEGIHNVEKGTDVGSVRVCRGSPCSPLDMGSCAWGGGGKEGMLGLEVPGSERYERIRTNFGGERDFFKLWGWMGLPYGPVRVVLGVPELEYFAVRAA